MKTMDQTFSARLVLLGLDGATFDLILPWAQAGYLPNLRYLMQQGSFAPLRSTLQPVTSAAWSSFLTGVQQGKHGLYDFIRRKPDSYEVEVLHGNHVHAPTLFELASRAGKRVISLNMPYTYPVRPLNGILVAGPFAPTVNEEVVYPPQFLATLRKIVPDYFIFPDFDSHHPNPLGDYRDKLLREIEQRETLSLYCLRNETWDIFSVVFMATDEVHHAYWHLMETQDPQYGNTILQIYQRVDAAIGKILATLETLPGQKNIFVVSDHGGGALKWMLNLNRYLADGGYLVYRSDGNGRGLIKQTASAYRRHVPPRLRAWVREKLGGKRFNRIKGSLETSLLTDAVDWRQTRVYALGAGGNLFVNLQGREPQGIVLPAEYEAVRAEIIAYLQRLREPESGAPLVKRVYRREELYHGAHLPAAPDLIIEWHDYSVWGRGRYDSRAPLFERHNHLEFSDVPLTGTHRPYGILIAAGAHILQGATLQNPHLIDLAPTLLGLLNLPIPSNLDGNPLTELLPTNIAGMLCRLAEDSLPESSDLTPYTEEEQAKITERLRSLGYL